MTLRGGLLLLLLLSARAAFAQTDAWFAISNWMAGRVRQT
jgi:hypothetical protein